MLSPCSEGQHGIRQVSDTVETTKVATPAPVPPFPQTLLYPTRCSSGCRGRGSDLGWCLMAPVLMLARVGWLPSPSQCDTLVTRAAHSWHSLGFSLLLPPLGLQPEYLALERLAAPRRIGRTFQMGTESTVPTGREKHGAQGDFLTIYRTGGIVYFLNISQGVHL